jgi:hypothetical protein
MTGKPHAEGPKFTAEEVEPASRKPRSRADKLLGREFFRQLEQKAFEHFIAADRYCSKGGSRLSKQVTRDPLFRAIRYCRLRDIGERNWASLPRGFFQGKNYTLSAESIQTICEEFAAKKLGPYDPEPEKLLAREFIQAVRQGDMPRLRELLKLCELHEEKGMRSYWDRQPSPRSWLYYTALAAQRFLRAGKLPTKKQVKEQALWERVVYEVPWEIFSRSRKDIEAALQNKSNEVRRFLPKNWRQIFNTLGLRDLPKAPTHPAR